MDRMGPGAIKQVKREIRVLGISARLSRENRIHLVGVVYRGMLWLDGVMRAESIDPDLSESIIKMIKGSPHYQQVRVLILGGDLTKGDLSVDPVEILTEIQRPVILMASNEDQSSLLAKRGFPIHSLKIKPGETVSLHSIGLTIRESERVLAASTRTNSLPEALRVAELVADSFVKYAQQNV